MLIKQAILDQIATGSIDLAFRRWKKPTVKAGGQLHTSIGVLAIDDVKVVRPSQISAHDAKRAGFDFPKEVLDSLPATSDEIYRITLRRLKDDPRLTLRRSTEFSEQEIVALRTRLNRLDHHSPRGAWTQAVLQAIADHPHQSAQVLARHLGYEKDWLKIKIRQLKELGLTLSEKVGYQLSPRGQSWLRHDSRLQ